MKAMADAGRGESPSPFAKPLAVGDRITITGGDGRERRPR